MNYSDILIPERSLSNRVVNIAIIMGTSWIVAISAQITINLPFSPVPITGQTLAVLLAGLFLGKNLGAASIAAYLAQGAAGLPFFAGGKYGLATLFGPTGGYLFGFLAAAYIVGMLSELRYQRSLFQASSTIIVGNVIIYIFGLVWLARFVGESQVLQVGLYPFLIGDLLKILLGIVLVGGSSAFLSRNNSTGNLV
ncbi:MAG: biotin transporter BioY [Chloroflexota bacterium]|nr:MAG: biotin transporter BioY [Chloroflexota bacterium]HDD60900.1 biotin transporter BioY [Chloroflexota bacterium]